MSEAEGLGAAWTEEPGTSEPEGRDVAWTEERETSDEGGSVQRRGEGGERGPGGERETENELSGKAPRSRAETQREPGVPVLERFSLAGKVALVTEVSGGLGTGFAVAPARAAAELVVAARSQADLQATSANIRRLGRCAGCRTRRRAR